MTRASSVRLFTGFRLLNAWFDDLDLLLHEACDRHLQYGNLEVGELPAKLRAEFLLEPLAIPGIVDITVEVHGSAFVQQNGASIRGHRASARIPYKGSRILLRTGPEPGFIFPYKGRVGAKSVKLDTVLPNLDPTNFVADATEQVSGLLAALGRSHATVWQYNDRIEFAIKRKLDSY